MKAKKTIKFLVFVIFIFFLIDFARWAIAFMTNPSPENIDKGIEFIAESAIPWWIQPIEWLSGLGEIGEYLIVAFLFFLTWLGERKKG